VERINFGGQRVLLHASQTGKKFNIVNAGVKVRAALSSTGVDTFISVLKKPVELNMQGYEIFGGGYNGDSYYGADGDDMLKLYTQAAPAAECEQEKRYARMAFLAGIPTPLSGELVTADGRRGVTFERIQGKKSISRLLADNPDKIEQVCSGFCGAVPKSAPYALQPGGVSFGGRHFPQGHPLETIFCCHADDFFVGIL
jgi:hypothetical protein